MDAHKNLIESVIVTPPNPATTGTSLTVTTGQGALFPTVPFNVTIWKSDENASLSNAEIVRVTNIVGDVLTIVRAQESTTARSIIATDKIAVTITAKAFTDIEDNIDQSVKVASTPVFGGVTVNAAVPVFKINDTTNDRYAVLVKSNSNSEFNLKSTSTVLGGASNLIPTMTSNTAPSGTASADTILGGAYDAFMAMDNTNTQFWFSNNTALPHWLKYQFGSAQVVNSYLIKSRTEDNTTYPTEWKLQGSNNGSTWTDLDSQTAQTFTLGQARQYTFTNSTAYDYFRLYITASQAGPNYVGFTQWELYNTANVKSESIVIAHVDSSVVGEYGVATFGDYRGETIVDGTTLELRIGGVVKASIASSGVLSIGTLAGILKGTAGAVSSITPLAGTKIYYVSDTSGGAVTRKLTFTDGVLTAET